MVILLDQANLPEDIYKVVFATEQQEVVAKLLVSYLWENGGEVGKTEMGLFASQLHEGKLPLPSGKTALFVREAGASASSLSYNKRQFYDRILTPMRGMGLIEYDLYKKTYRLSDKFNKLMIRIGLLWLRELEKEKRKQEVQKRGSRGEAISKTI